MSVDELLSLARQIKALDDELECPQGPRNTRQYILLLKQVRRCAVSLATLVA